MQEDSVNHDYAQIIGVTKFRHMSTCRCELPILFCNKCMPEMITSIQQNRRL